MVGKVKNQKYMPVGIDPGRNVCGVAILHPDRDSVITSFIIKNCSFSDAEKLIGEATRKAKVFSAEPIFVFEATNVFWRPLYSYLSQKGFTCHTVCAKQTKSSRSTGMRKTKTDTIDAHHIARLFQMGESHPTAFPPHPIMNLRELTRAHTFLVDLRARIFNRIGVVLFQINPTFTEAFSIPFCKTSLTLMREKLVHPQDLKETNIKELTTILLKASRGRLSKKKAEVILSNAQNTLSMTEAHQAFSSILSTLAEAALALDEIITSLEKEIAEGLKSVPQNLLTIPGMGPVGCASFIGELGEPSRFHSPDQVVAWFGLDPSLRQSGNQPGTGKHISKAGTKYGRRTMWLVARSFSHTFPPAKKRYKKLLKSNHWIDATTQIASDLVKICYAMLRDQTEFEPSRYH
jgi:transposase